MTRKLDGPSVAEPVQIMRVERTASRLRRAACKGEREGEGEGEGERERVRARESEGEGEGER